MPTKLPPAKSVGVETLKIHLREAKIGFRTEVNFYEPRKWRFDFALDSFYPLAVEIEGAIWTLGRHSRGGGMEADMEKYNQATLCGWCVLRFSTGMVKSGKAIDTIKRALK